jgi:serine/threonine protein kinase
MMETIGQYKLLDQIGSGGIGDLVLARDTKVGRTVALKVVSSDIAGIRAAGHSFSTTPRR